MIGAEVVGLDRLRAKIKGLGKQVRYASARALNATAFDLRTELQAEMRRVFDRPKPYIVNSIWVGKKASPESLEAWVYPRYNGGKGIDPEKVLLAEVLGGSRRNTRAEKAMQAAGILSPGMAMVPATWLRDSEFGDGHGGIKGPFYVRLLAYLNAFGEQGYRANMNDKGRRRLAKVKRSDNGFKVVRGVQYFVSRGRGEFTGRGSWKRGQAQHLPAGIWQRSGIHGSDVKPVFLFVRRPRYTVRFNQWRIAREVLRKQFPPHLRRELGKALASAR